MSVASCQLPAGPTTAGGQLPAVLPTSMTVPHKGGAFGNVLSAKMGGPAIDGRGSLSSARRANPMGLETTSGKNSGAVKLGDDKQIADESASAGSAVAAEILAAQSFVPTVLEDPHSSKSSLGGTPDLRGIRDSGGGPASNAAAAQPSISSVPACGARMQEAGTVTSPTGKPDATAAADRPDTTSLPAGDEAPSLTDPSASIIAAPQNQPIEQVVTAETASITSVTPPATSSGTLRPEATQQDSGHSSAQTTSRSPSNPAAAESGRLNPMAAVHATVPGVEMMQATTSRTAGAAVVNTGAMLSRNPAKASQTTEISIQAREAWAGKPDSYAQPPEPITDTHTETLAPQFTISDSKTIVLTPPVHPVGVRNEQQDPDISSSVVLPIATHAASVDSSGRGDRAQGLSEPAASSSAENVQAVPTVIQSAQVLERMGKSEIRLGLNSSSFGSIELHASVNQDRVGAAIATSHAELRTAMMAEMPSLEHAIAQHQMRLDSLQLDSRSGSQTGDSSPSGGNQSGPRGGTLATTRSSESSEDTAAEETSLPAAWTAPYSSGLNVHA